MPPSAPPWSAELGRFPGLFESFEAPTISWKPLVGQSKIDPCGASLVYPDWLRGSWEVRYKKQDVHFPQGWGVLAPTVGAEPKSRWSFSAAGSGSRLEWSQALPATLEAFWPDSTVREAAQRSDGLALRYAAPTTLVKKGNLTERTVTSAWLAGEVWYDDAQCLSAEWIRQQDELLAPNGVADYKVLMSLRKEGDAVAGQMRVAAFLQPVDERYFEANGNAVAIYDYGLRLTRVA